jgi:ribosome-associated protein
MLFQNTDNVVPVKKTPSSKIQDRSRAVANPQAAGKPKAASKPKAAGKPKLAGKPKPADNRRVTKAEPLLQTVVIDALADMKALEVKVLDVRGLTDIADFMVIASGTSDRHVRSVAQRVVEKTKEAGFRPHGVEGQQDSDWVLIDLSEMIVHVMLPRVREFYGLEKLWEITATKRAVRA